MEKGCENIYGSAVIETLADTYQQLYIAPGKGGEEKYREIVNCGHDAEYRDLSHFHTHTKDSLVFEDTPSGVVPVVTLYNREDFVTFLRIMGNRCTLAEIPDTQGAVILDGVTNWKKIHAHQKQFINDSFEKGIFLPDWKSEFARFASVKGNYLDAIIVLSVGPYSGVPVERMNDYLQTRIRSGQKSGMDRIVSGEKWLALSDTIRRYHECTHFICRRTYPDKIDPIWDELAADAVGIYAAFHQYDQKMGELFLGIENGRYAGGRLENYIKAGSEEEKKRQLNELVVQIIPVLDGFAKLISTYPAAGPYDLITMLEENRSDLPWSDLPAGQS